MALTFSSVRRLPRIGKIRLGVKSTAASGAEYPKAVDYFVVNADKSTPEAAMNAFKDVYGDKPRVLDIMFPVEDRETFFSQWHCRYGKGTGLICKGDGTTANEIDRETGELREVPCNPFECEWALKNHCRPVGRLQFLLYKVKGLGVWQIDTSSYNSIVNLNSAIDFVQGLTGGRISMIPLQLVLRPREVQVAGSKKTVYVMDINSNDISLDEVLQASRQTPGQNLGLPEPDLNEIPEDLFPTSLQTSALKPTLEPSDELSESDSALKSASEQDSAAGTPIECRVILIGDPVKADLGYSVEAVDLVVDRKMTLTGVPVGLKKEQVLFVKGHLFGFEDNYRVAVEEFTKAETKTETEGKKPYEVTTNIKVTSKPESGDKDFNGIVKKIAWCYAEADGIPVIVCGVDDGMDAVLSLTEGQEIDFPVRIVKEGTSTVFYVEAVA